MKFNHGVEIGVKLAYGGHATRTNDPLIYKIVDEEEQHRMILSYELACLNCKSSFFIDMFFTVVGTVISMLCKVCPISWLNFVARFMEIFAVFSYERLAKLYPARRELFKYG
jgi:hypothetical protein